MHLFDISLLLSPIRNSSSDFSWLLWLWHFSINWLFCRNVPQYCFVCFFMIRFRLYLCLRIPLTWYPEKDTYMCFCHSTLFGDIISMCSITGEVKFDHLNKVIKCLLGIMKLFYYLLKWVSKWRSPLELCEYPFLWSFEFFFLFTYLLNLI